MKMDVINDSVKCVNHIIHQFSSPVFVFVSPALLPLPFRHSLPASASLMSPSASAVMRASAVMEESCWAGLNRTPCGKFSQLCPSLATRNAGRNAGNSYDHWLYCFFLGECLRKSWKKLHLQKPELRVKCQTTGAPLHPMRQLQWGRGAHPACLRKRRHPCQILPLTSAPRRRHSILPMFISWHSDKVWYSDIVIFIEHVWLLWNWGTFISNAISHGFLIKLAITTGNSQVYLTCMHCIPSICTSPVGPIWKLGYWMLLAYLDLDLWNWGITSLSPYIPYPTNGGFLKRVYPHPKVDCWAVEYWNILRPMPWAMVTFFGSF